MYSDSVIALLCACIGLWRVYAIIWRIYSGYMAVYSGYMAVYSGGMAVYSGYMAVYSGGMAPGYAVTAWRWCTLARIRDGMACMYAVIWRMYSGYMAYV